MRRSQIRWGYMGIPKTEEEKTELRFSYISLLVHVAYWALERNFSKYEGTECKDKNFWYASMKLSTQLLRAPRKSEVEALLRLGLEKVLRCKKDFGIKKYFPRAPKRLLLKETPDIDPALMVCMLLRYCVNRTHGAGTSAGRDLYNVVADTTSVLLGELTSEQFQEIHRKGTELVDEAQAIVAKNKLPEPIPMPLKLEEDQFFVQNAERIRWMNLMDSTCDRG